LHIYSETFHYHHQSSFMIQTWQQSTG